MVAKHRGGVESSMVVTTVIVTAIAAIGRASARHNDRVAL